MPRIVAPVFSLCGLIIFSLASAFSAQRSGQVEYNRDVRPILSENCFPCHGPDSAARKADLRLDRYDDATTKLSDGTTAIVPKKPRDSEVVRRIFDDGDDHMPPAKSHKILTPAQKETLKQWITSGAKYQPLWSFIPPVKAGLPKVRNQKWVRNPIDQFILARLEQEKLKPVAEADRRALARRLSLDLTGLPPKPEEVEAFVNDRSPGAYEKLVDRWMATPQWGEHRARYWLDAARYGDTHGIHIDDYREIWTYRDWVINAFNTNMPFDQFTIEQLAGDLLPNATREQKVASGFNRCNITTSEGGAIDEEYYVLYARDRTETTAETWLGLTAGCAVCHDHKYDPISQKDFYAMSAFFNNTTQKAMDGNVKDTPPTIVIPLAKDDKRWDALPPEIAAADAKIQERKKGARPDFDAWLAKPDFTAADSKMPAKGLLFYAPLSDESSNSINVQIYGTNRTLALNTNAVWRDGAVAAKAFEIHDAIPAIVDLGDFASSNSFSYSAWVRTMGNNSGALFSRMEDKNGRQRGWDFWLEGGKPSIHILNKWPDDAIKVIAKKELPAETWTHIAVTYDGSGKAKGVKIFVNGEMQEVTLDRDNLKTSIHTESPFKIGERDSSSRLPGSALQDLRLYNRVLNRQEVRDLMENPRMKFVASRPADQRKTNELDEIYPYWLAMSDPQYLEYTKTKENLDAESAAIVKRGSLAFVMNEKSTPPEAYLLYRGNYDQRRDKLSAAIPKVFGSLDTNSPANRLSFAKWLVSPDHPLTARVTVNRFWQEIFGTGIVRTSGDFGVAGEMPSHPELLDWLAVDFREHDWDIKRLFKMMVMSATYRQSTECTPEKLAKDPQNRLLARGPRFRMDGEMVRDTALAASDLLVEKIGGPSVKPYQPDGVWEAVAMFQSDTRFYKQDHGDDLYRRSLYTFIKRAAPPASLEIFNAPNRQTSCVRRERTDTPLQALVTMNDTQFVEAARHLAENALEKGGKTDADKFDYMAERLIARPLNSKEKKIVEQGLSGFEAHYRQSPKDAEALVKVGESKVDPSLDVPTLAAYTMVGNELMNLDEVLNK